MSTCMSKRGDYCRVERRMKVWEDFVQLETIRILMCEPFNMAEEQLVGRSLVHMLSLTPIDSAGETVLSLSTWRRGARCMKALKPS
jgi:hypothetical protein